MVVKEFFENIINADKVLKHKHEKEKQAKENRIKIISEKLVRLPISVKIVPVRQVITTPPKSIDTKETTSPDISLVLNKLKGVTVKKTKVAVPSEELVEVPPVTPRRTSRTIQEVMYTEEIKASLSKEDDSDEEYRPPTSTTPRSTPKKKKLSPSANGKSPNPKPIIKMVLNTGPAYVCVSCKSRFESFEKLKDHMLESQKCKDANVTCQICNKVCLNRKALYAHSLKHKEKVLFTCETCQKSFANRFNLENHKVSVHALKIEENGSIFRCRLCEKQLQSRADLFTHMEEHQKEKVPRLCETCGKSFVTMDALRTHMRTHSSPRNYACTVEGCSKAFRSRVQLTQHTHVHTGVKSFACQKCDKVYAKKSSLSSHVKTHNHNGEMTQKCRNRPQWQYIHDTKQEHETTKPPETSTTQMTLVPELVVEEARTIEETVIIQPTNGQPSSYTLSFQNF